MPFKSEAQRRWMFAAESRGELPKGTAKRWAHETGNKKLPERKRKKKASYEFVNQAINLIAQATICAIQAQVR